MIPAKGEFRRFPWDDYRSRWYVLRVNSTLNCRPIIVLRRENSPHYADQAEITEELWDRGLREVIGTVIGDNNEENEE